MSLINETVTLDCYTVLLRQERCPQTGWKCPAPHGLPRHFSQPQTGLLPSLCQCCYPYLVCTASSGVPREDKELIISNYKLGSEHYAPCQGSKLIYPHCTGLWVSPKCPGRGGGSKGSTSGVQGLGLLLPIQLQNPPLKTRIFGRDWTWEVPKELAQPERSRRYCTAEHAELLCIHRARAGFAPKTTQTSARRQRAAAGWNHAGSCHLTAELRRQMPLAAAGPHTGGQRQGQALATFPRSFVLLHRFQCQCTNRTTLPQLSIISFAQCTTCFAEK